MRDTKPEKMLLFPARRHDRLGPELLEIVPRGLRLLVPRRSWFAAYLALSVAIVFPFGWAYFFVLVPAFLPPSYADSNPDPLVFSLKMAATMGGYYVVLLSIFLFVRPWRMLAWRPRKVVDLQFRAVELHRRGHWVWVRAEGQETWVRVAGPRRKIEAVLNLAQRTAGVAAPG